jgi:beta-galactosidase/beta-glucuronidase
MIDRTITNPASALLVLILAVTGAPALHLPLTSWRFFYAGSDTGTGRVPVDSSENFTAVTLPHTFPRQDTAGTPPVGIGWYVTDVPVQPAFKGKDIYLEFDGVCLRADIFANGRIAGKSPFPYVPFRVDLTPHVPAKGSVRLAIRVDNRLRERELPDLKANGWRLYGGLVREVNLSVAPKQRIDRAAVLTFHHAGDTFDLGVRLTPARACWDSVTLSLVSAKTPATVRKATVIGTDTTLRINGIAEWTPESPRRYLVTMTPWFAGKPGDTFRLRRGFSHMTSRGSTLLLNGSPVYLRGMSRHDVLDDADPLPDRKRRRDDLVEMKDLGVNFLRIAHFPQSRDIYELCDSLGILVMDEAPAWKTDAAFLGSREGREYGAAYMQAMIAAHGNYTSICLWSIGNQFASYKTSVAEYVDSVSRAARKGDPSRLVTYCSYYYLFDKGFPYADVIAINEYFGWELGSLPLLPKMLDKIHADWPDKPMIVSEFGAQAQRGMHNPQPQLAGIFRSVVSKDLSEEHQALYLQSHIDTILTRRSYVNGLSVWAYADYRCGLNKARTEEMPEGINACGIVTERRERKLAFKAVRERYEMIRTRETHQKNPAP